MITTGPGGHLAQKSDIIGAVAQELDDERNPVRTLSVFGDYPLNTIQTKEKTMSDEGMVQEQETGVSDPIGDNPPPEGIGPYPQDDGSKPEVKRVENVEVLSPGEIPNLPAKHRTFRDFFDQTTRQCDKHMEEIIAAQLRKKSVLKTMQDRLTSEVQELEKFEKERTGQGG